MSDNSNLPENNEDNIIQKKKIIIIIPDVFSSNNNITIKFNNNICLNNRNYFFNDKKSMNFIVHRNDGMNDYIIEMNITKSNNNLNLSKDVEFIIILDKSGSMGDEVHRLVSRIIPRALNLLNYSDIDIIHLITFESYELFSTKIRINQILEFWLYQME